jgi:hypothetical protein
MMGFMSSKTITSANDQGSRDTPDIAVPTQLSLLSHREVSPRFRLSQDTRTRGLRHVAEIRARLASGTGSGPDVADTTRAGTRAA